MRLNSMVVATRVWVVDTDPHPIQLKFGSQRYSMSREEAISYAAEIVAAVDELDTQQITGGAD